MSSLESNGKRIALKLSGEVLMGTSGYGIDPKVLGRVADDIAEVKKAGYQVAIIIGGGNIFRGVNAASQGLDRISADGMGMLATVINSLALQSAMEMRNIPTRVMSAFSIQSICEPFVHRRATRHLEKDRVVICAGGTGNPYFSTDTAAALRASELKCNMLLKGTKVDGVYDKDPKKYKDATLIPKLSFDDSLRLDIRVMDTAAFALARESRIPIMVFSILGEGNFLKALNGTIPCSKITDDDSHLDSHLAKQDDAQQSESGK